MQCGSARFSPAHNATAGDVSDYRNIDPVHGSLADAERFIADAHACGIKVIIDVVPNHSSSHHRFFREALPTAGFGGVESLPLRPRQGANGESPRIIGSQFLPVTPGPKSAISRDIPTGSWYLIL